MTFENIILILQTVGPFTVLITVYFLVTELKEQNRVARANARQNIADSHQKVALAGMKPILVDTKIKLRNNEELTKEDLNLIVVQINGKKRGLINTKLDLGENDVIDLVKKDQNINKYLSEKKVKKKVYIKNKLMNIII